MLFDRPDNRKELEQQYRRQLKDEVAQKKSRVILKDSSEYHPESQDFSLITNIEKEQEQRKKKSSNYYDELRKQIEEEKRVKKEAEDKRKRKEMEEENKLREEQENLKRQYED